MLIRWGSQSPHTASTFPEVMKRPSSRWLPSFGFAAVAVLTVASCLIAQVQASPGDQGAAYQSCVQRCLTSNCSTVELVANFGAQRPWYLGALRWDCPDECRHDCMWQALQFLRKRGRPVTQFHGKWPFLRFYGIQEPASVAFSILNGFCHLWMWRKFRRLVPRSAPHYLIWKGQAVLSINAWFWSTVFHARDTPVTEKLDYFCAFSLVLYSLYSLFMRVLGTPHSLLTSLSVTMPFVAFFAYHIHYLAFVHFDYGYNMLANVTAGLLNSLGWLAWCWWHRRRRPYVWRCAVVVASLNLLLLLELGDFPPWRFLLDAHALWHLGTAPLPLLWYRFLIDDSLYELRKDSKAAKDGGTMNGTSTLPCPSCESHDPLFSKAGGQLTQNGNSIGDCSGYT